MSPQYIKHYYKKFSGRYPVEKVLPFEISVKPENISPEDIGGHFAYLPIKSSNVKVLFTYTEEVMDKLLAKIGMGKDARNTKR